MCGIIGYTGEEAALPILVRGLRTLEYRGYDSAGIAVADPDGRMECVRAAGHLDQLLHKLAVFPDTWMGNRASTGIGHTRWATHGGVSETNAHPQSAGKITLVHNGIIENDVGLAQRLSGEGYRFSSETDTERAAAWIDFCYRETKDPVRALFCAAETFRGSYAFGVMFSDHPGVLYAMRKDSPLIIAEVPFGRMLGSDMTAILPYTREYRRLPENVVAVLTQTETVYLSRDGDAVLPPAETANAAWNIPDISKEGFPHFMLKEIFEEPEVLRRTAGACVVPEKLRFCAAFPDDGEIRGTSRVRIVACGSAMHAGLIGARYLERFAGIPASAELASEFRYREPVLSPGELVLVISQSGETSDTLAALRYAQSRGIRTLAAVNVPGSAIAREADRVIYTLAGPEIAVASTKAYLSQCAVLLLLALQFAKERGTLSPDAIRSACAELSDKVPDAVGAVLARSNEIRSLGLHLCHRPHLFFLGRGRDWDLAREASLKLKEISYLHSEAYAAGELKHGTISLITDGVPVIALLTERAVAEKTISGIRETIARGADVTAIVTREIDEAWEVPAHRKLLLPPGGELETLFSCAAATQLLSYATATEMGLNVDQPRNLAKSVTVE